MKDFGGLIRTGEGEPGRSPRAVAIVVSVICLAVGIAWLAQGRLDEAPEPPGEEKIETAERGIQASLDPRGETAERYPGSPWERRNNMLQEIVDLVEGGGDPYDTAEEVRDYARGIRSEVDRSCAELLTILSKTPEPWAGVVVAAGAQREALMARFDAAVAPWPEEYRRSLRGVKQLFICK